MAEKPLGLVAFDLDGTLLRGPTACEVLAARLGRLTRMRQFETLTRAHDIVVAREEMVGWFKGLAASELAGLLGDATLAPNAREAVDLLRNSGFAVAIVSITWDFAVARFARGLGVPHYSGTELLPDGRITHEWPEDKPRRVRGLANALGIPAERTAAVGDSAGDVFMLQSVGHPFFVGQRLPDRLELDRVTHLPDADMLTVARLIIDRMGHPPKLGPGGG
jgi:HAD superfamily phosphoserine phosphatase-like hydrolase